VKGKVANRLQAWRLSRARTIPATVRPDLAGIGPSPRARGEPFLTEAEVAAAIDGAIAARRPFSYLRLGDGEGALLGFARDATAEDLRYFLAHFDRPRPPVAIWRLRAKLLEAIAAADLVGIRDDVWNAEGADGLDPAAPDFLERFRDCFPLRRSETNLHDHGALRIFRLYEWWRQSAIAGAFCSQWVHADLQLRGYFDDLIAAQKRIGLITNATGLAERIRRRFGVEIALVPVPGNARNPGAAGAPRRSRDQHFAVWPSIAASIPRGLDGMVFLVGAGLVGKPYCTVVKANGGIALDLGALLDAWDGRVTRHLVQRSKAPLTASRFAPPPGFLLGHGPVQPAPIAARIILHAGFPATGEEVLQGRLRAGEATALADGGIRIAHAGGRDGAGAATDVLARAIAGGDAAGLQRLLAAIDREAAEAGNGTLFIGSPRLADTGPHRATEDIFLAWLLKTGVAVLFTLRPQFEWLVECHRRAAEEGGTGLFLDEFLADPLQLPGGERFDGNFLRKIEYFRRYLPASRVLAVRADGTGNAVIARLGLDPALLPVPVTPGPALPAEALAARILARRQETGLSLPAESPGTLADRAVLRGAHAPSREALRQEVMARFAEINREIDARFGVDLGGDPA
jgi:hypothetical protein